MKGTKIKYIGVVGVKIEFNLSELLVLRDLTLHIVDEANKEGIADSPSLNLAKIISKIPEQVFKSYDTFDNLMEDEDIFGDKKENTQHRKYDKEDLFSDSEYDRPEGPKIVGKIDLEDLPKT